jgi:hypothetical protein
VFTVSGPDLARTEEAGNGGGGLAVAGVRLSGGIIVSTPEDTPPSWKPLTPRISGVLSTMSPQ